MFNDHENGLCACKMNGNINYLLISFHDLTGDGSLKNQ